MNTEFASLKVIKNNNGVKCGFSLGRADTRHDFVIVQLPNEDDSQNDGFSESIETYLNETASLKPGPAPHQLTFIFKQFMATLNEWVVR